MTEDVSEKKVERRGGKREGAGRPTNAVRFARIREALDKELETIAQEYVPRSLLELVNGIYVEERVGREHLRRVYSVPPNITAIQEVLNRVAGKPVSAVELSGPDGGPIEVAGDIKHRLLSALSRLEDPVEERPLLTE